MNNRQKSSGLFSYNFFPKSHKGQSWIALVVILLIVVLGVGYYALNSTSSGTGRTTGNAVSGCQIIDVAASYLVVGPQACSGGSEAATCTIQLQNKESVAISAEPKFECTTSSGSQFVSASKQSLTTDQVGSFAVSFNNAGLDWTCTLYNAQTTKPAEVCN